MKSSVGLAWISVIAMSLGSALCAGTGRQEEEKPATGVRSVSSVSLNFSPGFFNKTFEFAITLKKDGTALYVLRRDKVRGTYRATGLQQDFGQIEKLINDVGYWGLPPHFGHVTLQGPSSTVSVSGSGSQKTIVDAGRPLDARTEKTAPEALKLIERQLARLTSTAHWDKISDKTDFPGAHNSGE